ncbi:3-phosphoserine/phosphohydroxythreonine transaminase [Buchnera aphidicola (Ceratovacuna keduensis)]|uniref:3-phosphoserine/phosphohydroxythreonine transaminase n=1 Tax=Buchnera aphidicola TaxID=9 RepID=UPI0031B80DD2
MCKIYNFSAGPSILPIDVMKKANKEFLNWKNSGSSIIEISHRSKIFISMTKKIEKNFRNLLNIPNNYKILFLHGGARGQFSAVPMNLLKSFDEETDYINTGYWSMSAAFEAMKYSKTNIIDVKKIKNRKKHILKMSKWNIKNTSKYIHYCPNETIEGIAIHEEPNFYKNLIVGDFSSSILSRKIKIQNYDLIYASSQKNIGPSGITILIIKKKLLFNNKNKYIPSILDYYINYKNNSMFNTPSTFSWYMSGLIFDWILKNGGIEKIEKNNFIKSKLLYDTIDNSNLYINDIHYLNRSIMNVTFRLKHNNLNKKFLEKSEKEGLLYLRGHSLFGGMRASIYNAMPIEGVKKLSNFMIKFEKKFG